MKAGGSMPKNRKRLRKKPVVKQQGLEKKIKKAFRVN